MIRKLSLAFMGALALGACNNAVGPNASKDPFDPVNEEAGKEEYFDPTMPTTPENPATPGTATLVEPDTTVD
jgi:hypothetical protein